MRKSWLIAVREWNERVKSRSFLTLALVGPLLLLFLLFILFQIGGKKTVKWKILVADKGEILSNKMAPREDPSMNYFFINDYVEIEEFAKANKYQEFDALLEVNEKVLSNKVGFVFYRELPSTTLEKKVQFQLERRLEEVLVKKYNEIDLEDFRKIKQPLTLSFRNVYDPQDQGSDKRGWVGLFFGGLIFVFIALYGMTILRATSKEKTSRIAEVLLGAVRPMHLMMGKIMGIGAAAFVQFAIWAVIIVIGLSWMRETYFPDYLQANLNQIEQSSEVQDEAIYQYNEFVDLVFERIQFAPVLTAFAVFFVLGYFFYSSIFSACGASLGSESDGQQFVIPLLLLLLFGGYAGYYVLQNPGSDLASFFLYLPFTAPCVALVKLSLGFVEGTGYQLYLSALVLLISTGMMLFLSSRIYRQGILASGYRLRFSHLIKWLKRK